MHTVSAAALTVVAAVSVFAQAPQPRVEFEVASVRHSADSKPEQASIGLHMDGSQVRIAYVVMRDYIAMAFAVRSSLVSGPDWITTERFDLNAKLPAGASATEIPEMLQAVLADRFQLKIHREKKDVPVYALILGKGPLKLKQSAPNANSNEPKGAVNVAASGSAAGVSANLGNGSYYTFGDNKFEAGKMTMDALVRMLSGFVNRPILDLTGLKGTYDLTLNVAPEDYQAMLIRAAVNNGVVLPPQALRLLDDNAPASLFDAIQQLGLRLDARKLPLDALVIDQISKTPTDN